MSEVDMSPAAIEARLRQVSALWRMHPANITRRLRAVAALRNLCIRLGRSKPVRDD